MSIELKDAQVGDEITVTFKGKVSSIGMLSGLYAADDKGYTVFVGSKDNEHYDITITRPEPEIGSQWVWVGNKDFPLGFVYIGNDLFVPVLGKLSRSNVSTYYIPANRREPKVT